MATQSVGISLDSLDTGRLLTYLHLTDWALSDSTQRWYVFQSNNGIDGSSIEIVLPKNFEAPDTKAFVISAIDIINGLQNEPIERTLFRISYVNSDALLIRNIETGETNTLSLRFAYQQVGNIKQLVKFSASSELEPRPYFNVALTSSNRMVEHYRFGHTFSGSFGLTIEAPITRSPFLYQHEVPQSTLFDVNEYIDIESIVMPMERRVMERIARGLQYTREATQAQNTDLLVQEYSSGLNSNMCRSVVGISQAKTSPVEYSILWSPRLKSSEDLSTFNSIRLNETSYALLEEASEILKTIEPEVRRVRGLITELSSEGDPLGDNNTDRSVVVRWINRERGERSIKIFVSLSREDYIRAHRAHLSWSTVEVTGIVQRVGTIWRLIDPSDFDVVN